MFRYMILKTYFNLSSDDLEDYYLLSSNLIVLAIQNNERMTDLNHSVSILYS